jgi:hypothetical protein
MHEFSSIQLAGLMTLISLAVGYIVGQKLGFTRGTEAVQQYRREAEHKFHTQLHQCRPAHAAALLVGELYSHYQPTPLMWKALTLVGQFCKSKEDFKLVRRRILEVTDPTFSRSRKRPSR